MLCSVSMPADYEVSSYHRPPVRRPASLNLAVPIPGPTAPRRPCLVVRDEEPQPAQQAQQPVVADAADVVVDGEAVLAVAEADGSSSSTASSAATSPQSPTRLKKRVVFADDAGRQLTHVKVMTEPSFAPPRWNMAFLAQVTRGATAEGSPEPWEALFAQPASDYLAFRARLDRDNVSLENVIVREAEQVVVGTVKVRNLAFHKEVLIRSTSDDWRTHEDAYCTFVQSGVKAPSVTVLYDTFSFRLALPPQSRRLEFCVCFRCGDREHWDSNAGKNYVLLKKCSSYNPTAASFGNPVDELTAKIGELATHHNSSDCFSSPSKYNDAVHAKVDSWSEFASWNHLSVDGPYW